MQLPYIKHGIFEVPEGTLIIKYLQNAFPDKALTEPSDPREVRRENASSYMQDTVPDDVVYTSVKWLRPRYI